MSIPPLLCSTPPPLSDSDDKDDDDFGGFESAAEFAQFDETSLPATPLHKTKTKEDTPDLPVPSDVEFQIYSTTANIPPAPPHSKTESTCVLANDKNTIQICDETPTETLEEVTEVDHSPESPIDILSQGTTADAEVKEGAEKLPTDDQMCILAEDDDLTKSPKSQNPSVKSSRAASPQSLELSTGNLSIDDDEGDIDDASIVDFQVAEQKYDDNTSLPSFDSISVSKSTTPIPGNDKPPPHESPTDEFKNLSDKSISSAFQSPDNEVATNDDDITKFEPPEERFMGLVAESCEPMGASEHEANEFAKVTISELIPNCPQTKAKDFHLDPDEQNKTFQTLDPTEDSFAAPIPQELSAGTTTEATESFDADFSQFEAFNAAHPKQDDFQLKSQTALNEEFPKNTITELGNNQNDKGKEVDDDFEDFQDFASSIENAVVEDDDEFGDFSDFKDASPLDSSISSFTQTALKFSSIDERLKPVLEMMFPIENDTTTAADQQSILQDFRDNVVGNLKDLESAKALDYQWSSSSIKHSLITALGIDSRNILYGEKWNSSMPRFAANLGFNPLEPLKPTPLTSSSGPSCGQGSNTQRTSGKPTSGNEVPAVQFDWNTSGLVNPLDASHAHTLLLDLDQLVVVANLDKINLDSSSPCSSAALTSPIATVGDCANLSAATTIVTTTTTTINAERLYNTTTYDVPAPAPGTNNAYNPFNLTTTNIHADLQSAAHQLQMDAIFEPFYSTATICSSNLNNTTHHIMCKMSKTQNHNENNDNNKSAFDTNVNNCDADDDYCNDIDDDDDDPDMDTIDGGGICNSNDCIGGGGGGDGVGCIDNTLYNLNLKSFNCTTSNNVIAIPTYATNFNVGIANESNMFDYYLDCRIKEILHERKIEEVHTSRLGDINQLDDIQQTEEMTIANEEKDSAGSNLSAKDSGTYLPGTNNDLISDYHLKRDHIDNLRHAPTTFVVPLKETHIFTPDKSENTISRCVKSSDNKCPIDFDYEMAAAGIIIDEQVVKKEYRDIEYNPDKFSMNDVSNVDDYLPYVTNVTKHSTKMEGVLDMKHDGANVANDWHLKDFKAKDALAGSLDSFSEFQTAPVNFLTTADMEKELETKTERSRIIKSSTLDELPKQSSAEHDPTTIMDDEFCEFQSVPPIAAPTSGLTAGKENRIRSNLEDKPRSRTGTPTEMILSPAVLLPQSIQIEPSPQINWPEPGIDPDELARLEQLFPQPKNNQQSHSVTANADKKSTDHSRITRNASNPPASRDDEDWSDFISVPAPSTASVKPTTNSASSTKPNKTICSDDDDWSDFVSSAPPQLPSNNFRSWNLTQMPPPNFNSWHQPNAYGSNVGHILNATTNVAAPTTLFCQHHNNNNNINHSTSKTMLQQNIFNGYSSTGMMQSHVNSHHQQIQYPQQQHSVFSMGGQQNHFAQHQMQQQPQRNQAVLKSQLNKAPSIALIPDLGFVSPRTFINVPKNTYNKK